MRLRSLLSSVQGFSVIVIIECLLTAALGLICWIAFDGTRPQPFGLRPSIAQLVGASFSPIVLATFLGFRDVAFSTLISIGDDRGARPLIRIESGILFLYFISAMGFIAAMGTIILASIGVDDLIARRLVAAAALVWGATTGAVFDRFFRVYTRPGGKAGDEIDDAQPKASSGRLRRR